MNLELWLHLAGALLAVTLVRGMAVFLAALAVTGLVRRLSAETRHLIWLGVITGFLLIPLAWLLLPPIRIGAAIALGPAAPLRLAAAPVLSAGEYARLVGRAGASVELAARAPGALSLSSAIGLALLCCWPAGVLALAGRLVVGKRRLLQLAAGARASHRLQAAADALARLLAQRRSVPVAISPLCRIPFVFGLLRPRIVLPQEAAQWPAGKLSSALTHELTHIRRHDPLAQTAGYAICVLFWFLPPLWVAYAAMLREAETCCDQQVINRGFRGPEYAHDIVELARNCEGRILLPSISSAIGSKSLLKERIRRVLCLKPGRRQFGARAAVRVLAICLACMVPILALAAQVRPKVEPLYGTWVEEYGTRKGSPQRVVIFADGREMDYTMMADEEPYFEYDQKIIGQWIDREGNSWYQIRYLGWYHEFFAPNELAPADKGYSLQRIDASGTRLEGVQAESRIPDEEDWSLIPHWVYRKQQVESAADQPLYGTWVNERFGTGKGGPQKCVLLSDGRELDYLMMTDKEPWVELELKIEDQWRDEQGNYWYTLSWKAWYYGSPSKQQEEGLGCGSKGYSLVKVDASGTTIESVQAESRIPDAEDWGLIPHPVYYRRQ